jgi:hypothetical protein
MRSNLPLILIALLAGAFTPPSARRPMPTAAAASASPRRRRRKFKGWQRQARH